MPEFMLKLGALALALDALYLCFIAFCYALATPSRYMSPRGFWREMRAEPVLYLTLYGLTTTGAVLGGAGLLGGFYSVTTNTEVACAALVVGAGAFVILSRKIPAKESW